MQPIYSITKLYNVCCVIQNGTMTSIFSNIDSLTFLINTYKKSNKQNGQNQLSGLYV